MIDMKCGNCGKRIKDSGDVYVECPSCEKLTRNPEPTSPGGRASAPPSPPVGE